MAFIDIKRQARRDVHAAFSLSALYEDDTVLTPETLSVRWHDRSVNAVGDIPGGDYGRVFENVDKIIFDADELTAKGIEPKRNGTVTLTDLDLILTLDVREPYDGPVKVIWTVIRG